ncbi:MAG TPA: hypothetical protein VM008_01990 [Phycisphaerae bacterium]|nr:hypothetical protein [Phycisphaerae bacterium]
MTMNPDLAEHLHGNQISKEHINPEAHYYVPPDLDADFPEAIRDRYKQLCVNLDGHLEKYSALAAERKSIRDAIIDSFDFGKLEELKKTPWKLMKLFQQEVAMRQELASVLKQLSSESVKLHEASRAALQETRDRIRSQILSLGYDETKVGHHLDHQKAGLGGVGEHDSIITLHPEVIKAQSRLEYLSEIRMRLVNHNMTNSPTRHNDARGAHVERCMEQLLKHMIEVIDGF